MSEKYYDQKNVYTNVGDSAVSMGRIAWAGEQLEPCRCNTADGHARHFMKDQQTFDQLIMEPIQHDVEKFTWLFERYDCHKEPGHSPYFVEYPEVVSMLLREVRYGISIQFGTMTLDPLVPEEFIYNIGNLYIKYSKQSTCITLPNVGKTKFSIHGLLPTTEYQILNTNLDTHDIIKAQATTSCSGILKFQAFTGVEWRVCAHS